MTVLNTYRIRDFIKYTKSVNLFDTFSTYEIYIWSNFGFNTSKDIDLIFIGEPTETIGQSLYDLKMNALPFHSLDITLLPDTRMFSYIPGFNKSLTNYYFPEKIIRYKLGNMQKHQHDNGWICTEHSKHLWKIEQTFARKDTKYRDRDWHYPMLLENFIKLHENIRNGY